MWEKRRLSQLPFSTCLQTKIKVTHIVVVVVVSDVVVAVAVVAVRL